MAIIYSQNGAIIRTVEPTGTLLSNYVKTNPIYYNGYGTFFNPWITIRPVSNANKIICKIYRSADGGHANFSYFFKAGPDLNIYCADQWSILYGNNGSIDTQFTLSNRLGKGYHTVEITESTMKVDGTSYTINYTAISNITKVQPVPLSQNGEKVSTLIDAMAELKIVDATGNALCDILPVKRTYDNKLFLIDTISGERLAHNDFATISA